MDAGTPHHGHVEGIASGEPIHGAEKRLGSPHLGDTEGKDLVGDRIQFANTTSMASSRRIAVYR